MTVLILEGLELGDVIVEETNLADGKGWPRVSLLGSETPSK